MQVANNTVNNEDIVFWELQKMRNWTVECIMEYSKLYESALFIR